MNKITRLTMVHFQIISAFSGLQACVLHAQNSIVWQSLGLGQSVRALTNADLGCSFSSVRTRVSPSANWALDKPFAVNDFGAKKDDLTFIPSDELRMALPLDIDEFNLISNKKKSLTYGVVVFSGDAAVSDKGVCNAAQATKIRVGHFAFLNVEIHFVQARLESYLRKTFQLESLSPTELLMLVESLKKSLPNSVFIRMSLASDLGDTLQNWDSIGRSLAFCNAGQVSACSDAIKDFSSTLQSATGIADLVANLKRQPLLLPNATMLGAFVELDPSTAKFRLKSKQAEIDLNSLLASLKQSLSPTHLLDFTKIQASAFELAKQLEKLPGTPDEERELEKHATSILKAALNLALLEQALIACEILERNQWSLLERIVAPQTLLNCSSVAQVSKSLKSWHLETSEDLNSVALPLLLSRQTVKVSQSMLGQTQTPLFLLNLPYLEEVKVTAPVSGFLFEILERSGVRIVKE